MGYGLRLESTASRRQTHQASVRRWPVSQQVPCPLLPPISLLIEPQVLVPGGPPLHQTVPQRDAVALKTEEKLRIISAADTIRAGSVQGEKRLLAGTPQLLEKVLGQGVQPLVDEVFVVVEGGGFGDE